MYEQPTDELRQLERAYPHHGGFEPLLSHLVLQRKWLICDLDKDTYRAWEPHDPDDAREDPSPSTMWRGLLGQPPLWAHRREEWRDIPIERLPMAAQAL